MLKRVMAAILSLMLIGTIMIAVDIPLPEPLYPILRVKGNTITVDDDQPADYTTIQNAIDNANPNDDILVYPGTYYENVIVNKSVNIVGTGAGEKTIDANGLDHGIWTDRSQVAISGFTIINTTNGHAGIFISQDRNLVTISNCTINNCSHGIDVISADNLAFRDNIITDNTFYGLRLRDSSNTIVERNRFSNNSRDGLYITQGSSDIIVRENTANDNDNLGIYLCDSNNNNFIRNTCNSNGDQGIRLHNSTQNSFQRNSCGSNNNDGIRVCESNSTTLESNICNGNGYAGNWGNGIYLERSSSVVLNYNTMNSNHNNGLKLGDWQDHITGNLVENNTCQSNGDHGIFVQKANGSVINNNNCSQNYENGSHGIRLWYSNQNHIERNDIFSNGDTWGDGIFVSDHSDRNTLVGNRVNGNAGRGIGIEGSCNNTIRENNCTDNNEQGISVGYPGKPSNDTKIEWNTCTKNGHTGILVDSGERTRLSNNSCKGNGKNGIRIGGVSGSLLRDNTCNGNDEHGLELNEAPRSMVINMECNDNIWNGISHYDGSHEATYTNVHSQQNQGKGMHITKSDHVQVHLSKFLDNEEGGIIVNDEQGVAPNEYLVISDCTIDGNNRTNLEIGRMRCCNVTCNTIRNSSSMGINAQVLEHSTFVYNFITGNVEEGIHFEDSVCHNTLYYNFLIDNMADREDPQAADSSETNRWDNGDGVGNFWSDYRGRYPDAISRGGIVWLTPYQLNEWNGRLRDREGNYDRYPMVNPPEKGPIVNSRTGLYNWSIADALETAGPGDTISILIPGYYDEENLDVRVQDLLLNKTTEGVVIINGSGEETGMTINAKGVEICGIDFENHTKAIQVLEEAENTAIIDSRINNMRKGAVYLRGTKDVRISDCVLHSPGRGYNCGIQIKDSQEVTFNNCSIRNWGCGVQAESSLAVQFRYNEFLNCGQGLNLRHTSESTVEENDFEYCDSGIWVESNANGNYIAKNTINNHDDRPVDMIGEDASYGIMIAMGAKNNVIEENVVAECNLGIGAVLWASDNEINNNLIKQCNLAGLSFWVSDFANSVSGNKIFGSKVGIWINSSSNCDINYNVLKGNEIGIKIDNESFEFDMDGSQGDGLPYLVENGSHDNIIKFNEISMGEYGIVANGGWDNYLVQNNLADNINQTMLPEGSLICEMEGGEGEEPMMGNYWSNYQGRDDGTGGREAGDGMGDTDLPHEGIDFYPLMSPVEGPGYLGEMLRFIDHTDGSGAYVGGEFAFRIEVKSAELDAPDKVLLEHWYPNGMRILESMEQEEGDNWTLNIVIENSVGDLHYFVRASPKDTERWGYGPVWSLGLKDEMPPEIIIINVPEEVEFGENLTFGFDVFDGARINNVSLEYWIGNGSRTNVTFTPPGPFTYVFLPDTPGILHYIIWAMDEFGNENRTPVRDILISKELEPKDFFGKDLSDGNATTGDTFRLFMVLKELKFIDRAQAVIVYDNGNPFPVGMEAQSESNRTITVPSDGTMLHYHFEVIDVYNVTHVSFEPREIRIRDNDRPVLLDDITPVEIEAPGQIIFELKVVDNIGVESVKVEYWFDSGGNKVITLSEFEEKGLYKSEAVAIAQTEDDKLYYKISMEDTAGNINTTDKTVVDIKDAGGGGGGDDDDDNGGTGPDGFFSSPGGIAVIAVLIVLIIVIVLVVILKKRKRKEEPASEERIVPGEGTDEELSMDEGSAGPEEGESEAPGPAAPVPDRKDTKKDRKERIKEGTREGRSKRTEKTPEDIPEEELPEEPYDNDAEEYDAWDGEEPEDWDADADTDIEEAPLPPPPDDFKEHLPSLSLETVSSSIKNIIPGYIITDKLGAGGFATVYKAINKDGVAVAIKMPKFLDETIDSSVLNKFQAEADIWKKLRHPNIVTFLDSNIRPVPYMTIELMEGGNLGGLLKDHKLSVDEVKPLMLQILDGLSYAHRMASVHRDIKPENILFTSDGIPKIADWGIGKFMASESVSQSIGTKGTFLYSAPEQFDKATYGEVDWSTDIFQIGVVFYEMLTGINPFKADELAAVMGRILTIQPAPPSSLDPDIPPEIDEIVMKCLEKHKEDRWRSTDVLYSQLKQIEKKKKMNLQKYRKMLERALSDGSMSSDEEAMLMEFREHMNVTDREHEVLMNDITGDLFVIET